MLDDAIDDAVPQTAHLVRRQRQHRALNTRRAVPQSDVG
jgi:hypothetical protein